MKHLLAITTMLLLAFTGNIKAGTNNSFINLQIKVSYDDTSNHFDKKPQSPIRKPVFTKLYIKEILNDIYSLQPLLYENSIDTESELGKNTTIYFTENPVSSNGTDVKLDIPVASKVSLQITEGENGKTTDIINGMHYDRGTYVMHLDASQLSRGMNICTLKIGDKKIVRKLLKK